MEPDREKLMEDLYQKAVDLPLEDRDVFLVQACNGDEVLRREVEALLHHGDAAPSRFLAGAADAAAEVTAAAAAPLLDGMVGRTVGRYKLLRVIASGGMGTVYEARQEQPSRTVAIKLIRQGLGSSAHLRRFQYESEVLGQLNHPGIAQIFESGVHREAGGSVPYFAMEYLADAVPVTQYATVRSLRIKDRIRLFLKVCHAVQYAHQRAVIHRDLKPANVLVTSQGSPKIIDFGVARVLQSDQTDLSAHTQTGQVLGTLRYMSPEQCGATPTDVDARTDIYALGVILFELLTGQLPYDLGSISPFDAPRVIRDTVPTRPCVFKRELSGDAEAIILKALEKSREQRYQTVSDMGADLQHFLSNESVSARRHSRWYVFRKAMRKHAVAAAVGLAFLMLIVGSAVALGLLYREADMQRRLANANLETAQSAEARAKEEAEVALRVNDYLQSILSSISPEVAQGRDVTVLRDVIAAAAARVVDELADQPIVAAAVLNTIGVTYDRMGDYKMAVQYLRNALALRRLHLGERHPDTLISASDLGGALTELGRFDEAEPLLMESLEHRKQILGERHVETLNAMNKLGYLYSRLARYDEAERYYLEVLTLQREVLGADHEDSLVSANNLALLYDDLARDADAERLFREVLDGRRRSLGDKHPQTLNSVNNLALFLSKRRRVEEAGPLFEEALRGRTEVLGEAHPSTLTTLNNLALMYGESGPTEKAEPLYRKALNLGRSAAGTDPLRLATIAYNLASLYRKEGRLDEAEPLYVEALEIRERLLPEDHPSVLKSVSGLALLHKDRGRFEQALPIFERLLDVYELMKGEENRDTILVIHHVATTLEGLERWAEADFRHREAIQRARTAYPSGHWLTGILLSAHGAMLTTTGDYEAAAAALAEAEELLTANLGPDNPQTSLVRDRKAALDGAMRTSQSTTKSPNE